VFCQAVTWELWCLTIGMSGRAYANFRLSYHIPTSLTLCRVGQREGHSSKGPKDDRKTMRNRRLRQKSWSWKGLLRPLQNPKIFNDRFSPLRCHVSRTFFFLAAGCPQLFCLNDNPFLRKTMPYRLPSCRHGRLHWPNVQEMLAHDGFLLLFFS